ncbi:MAG: carboxymuconolactone decarboxylase family protein [Pseudomonas sp.]|uniref:carboxymuconolactone decarboxylase family protein n=1 Tax=Pseudomonas sp. TaxID=306 RepID=UPI00122197F9|nr:carboxymuconolactone decarboxylase family protein [Pseudomonas sp.]RZI72060.1 MAG: carboxymuconolactone decarboxylase family protein [Pseudomonas sp.]
MPIEDETNRTIMARHNEVLGSPPRIPPVDRQAAAAEVQASTKRLIGSISGRDDMPLPPVEAIPEIMFTLCRFPTIWQAVMDVTVPLQGPASQLPLRDRKLAILRTGWLCGAPYEFGEHVAQAKRMGITTEEIEAIVVGSGSPIWDDHECAILKAVEELHENAMVDDETWAKLAEKFDDAQMFELLILIGQFTATAYFQNSLRLRLEANNEGLAAR